MAKHGIATYNLGKENLILFIILELIT